MVTVTYAPITGTGYLTLHQAEIPKAGWAYLLPNPRGGSNFYAVKRVERHVRTGFLDRFRPERYVAFVEPAAVADDDEWNGD
ncbi:MAG: hypothetical protein HY518_04650 [Candidatus Aenigmarchaeota archaeon]|nr:hypothetical protein [Candidatus Aenigmarchaeota archaeon]